MIDSDCLKQSLVLKYEYNLNPVMLLMCSPTNPGGGWKTGAMGQEESVCRRTNLWEILESCEYPQPEFGCFYIKKCLVIRKSESESYAYMKQVREMAMMTGYCYAHPPVDENGEISGKLRKLYVRKIETMFSVAKDRGHDSLVLGAFGCGIFANPPKAISHIFRAVMRQKRFSTAFKRIEFAILANGNMNNDNLVAFRKTFE